MTVFQAIILGVIEGVTEFLPVSSTGHLMLGAYLLGLPSSNFLSSFGIIIQLGAILSVIFLYWRRFLLERETVFKVLVAFLPTAIIGFSLYKIIKSVFLTNNWLVVFSLFVGGIILILFEIWLSRQERDGEISQVEQITYKQSFLIGVCQSLAVVPGVSRSGATIVSGLALKFKRELIVEFSFLLAVPTMISATGYDILKNYQDFSSDNLAMLAIGFVVSFLVALLAIKTFLAYIRNNNFIAFGIYRMAVAIVFALIFLV